MPDITLTNEELDLTVAILNYGPAVSGSKSLASKFEHAWIAQSAEDGEPQPVTMNEEELNVATRVISVSKEPGAEELKGKFVAAGGEEPPPPPPEGGEGNTTITPHDGTMAGNDAVQTTQNTKASPEGTNDDPDLKP